MHEYRLGYQAMINSMRNEISVKKEKDMELFLVKYINKMLKKADYEYDPATNSWCASLDKLPGVYAQADTIEDARSELAEIIEEYVFVSLQEGHPLPEFKNFSKVA
jgi:predicted RNase H-like HicB family nuclease